MMLIAWLLVCAALVVNAQTARCFVRHYDFVALPTVMVNGTAVDNQNTVYYTELDVLNAAPLLIEFDDVPLGKARKSGCPRNGKIDMLHFVYAETASFHAPFCSLPLKCVHNDPLSFALSTLGEGVWGADPRIVSDGAVFRPQYGRASMLSGIYMNGQEPQRHRPLTIRMASYRAMDRPMPVRVCIRSDQVPYDMPADAVEVDAPRLLPLMSCTKEFGGRCSANLGYVNSAGMDLDLKYPSGLNKLAPPELLNGFQMPTTFGVGWHDPASFKPPLHVTWRCDYGYQPPKTFWLLDGYYLMLNNHDYLCNDATNTMVSSAWESPEDAEARFIARFQNQDPRLNTKLKVPKHSADGVITISAKVAQAAWKQAGIERTHMLTVASESHVLADQD